MNDVSKGDDSLRPVLRESAGEIKLVLDGHAPVTTLADLDDLIGRFPGRTPVTAHIGRRRLTLGRRAKPSVSLSEALREALGDALRDIDMPEEDR